MNYPNYKQGSLDESPHAPLTVMLTLVCMLATLGALALAAVCWLAGGKP